MAVGWLRCSGLAAFDLVQYCLVRRLKFRRKKSSGVRAIILRLEIENICYEILHDYHSPGSKM